MNYTITHKEECVMGRKRTVIRRERCVYCEEHRVSIAPDRSNEEEVCGRCYNYIKKYADPPKKKKVLTREYSYFTYIRPKALERDEYKCVQCGSTTEIHVHHIIERKNGGSDELDNLQTLCRLCHSKKHPTVSFLKP